MYRGVWYIYRGSLVRVSGEFGTCIVEKCARKLLYYNDLASVLVKAVLIKNYEEYKNKFLLYAVF
jgi:hypothetical protein